MSLPKKKVTFMPVKLPPVLVRNLQPGEEIPFIHGLESMTLDPRWVWVAIHQSNICGVLIGANVHGMFYVLRIVVSKRAPNYALLVLLRQVRESVLRRGLHVWTTFMMPSPDTPTEEKLTKIAASCDAQILPVCGVWAVGKV